MGERVSARVYLAAASSMVSFSSLISLLAAALNASDWSNANGNVFVLEKRTDAMTNFSSLLENPKSRDPTLAMIQEMKEKSA